MPLGEKNKADVSWIIHENFRGFQTKYYKSHPQARGYLVGASQNCVVNDDGSISPRFGYSLFGNFVSTATPIKTLLKFQPRTGNDILLRTWGTVVEYYSTHSSLWETLLSGVTTGLVHGWEQMDFTDDSGTTPSSFAFENLLFFGNGTDAARSWNGATAKISSTTATTIVITGSTTPTSLEPPFKNSGSSQLIINGTVYTYTGVSGQSFTGVTPNPTGEANGSSVAQVTVDETTAGATQVNGNVYHKTDNARLAVSGATNAQGGIYVSKTNNPRSFTFSNPRVATDGAVINVTNFVKALEQLSDKIYYLCPDLIGWLRFTQIAEYSGGYDLIEIRPEVKGYDIGPTNILATAKWDNKIMYASQHAIKDLGSVVSHATNQVDAISEAVEPSFLDADLSSAALAVYLNKLYVACKKTSDSDANDIVYIYDILAGQWEAPLNLAVSCWTVANGNLYYGNALTANIYQLEVKDQWLDSDNDGTGVANYSVSPIAELWQENFGLPFDRKTLYGVFLEGEIAQGAQLDGVIYLDEDGYSGSLSFSITGTQTGIIFQSSQANTFALQSFATRVFAGDEVLPVNYFRVIFEPRSTAHFYVVNAKFSSTSVDGNFKIKRLGWRVSAWSSEDASIKVVS